MADSTPRLARFLRRLRRLLLILATAVAALAAVLIVFELTEPAPEPHAARTDGWFLHKRTTLPTEVPGLTIQHFDGQHLWANRYDEVWRSDGPGGAHWERMGALGSADPSLLSVLEHAAWGSRAARLIGRPHGIEALLPLPSGTVLAARPPHLYRSADGGRTWEGVLQGVEGGRERGLFRDWGTDEGGRVWVADSTGRGRLLQSDDDGLTFVEAWALPEDVPGRIRRLRVDPFRGRPWVGVGGVGAQLQVGWVDEIGTWHPIGAGEPWLEISDLVFTGGEVYLVNGLPRGPTGVWRYSRARDSIERIGDVGGPVLDAGLLRNEELVVATAAAGLGEADVQLWAREANGELRQVAQLPTFRRHREATWGTLWFPTGEPLPDLRFTAERVGKVRRSLVVGELR